MVSFLTYQKTALQISWWGLIYSPSGLTNIVTIKRVLFSPHGLQIASKISAKRESLQIRVELLYLMQTLWVAHQNVNCIPFIFNFFYFGENISNQHMHPIITGGKFQHRSLGFLDDHGPLPSCCGKYHIYNFGNRTGALEMWDFFFF